MRVLLVDDSQVIREGLKNFFSDYSDLEVIGEAKDGQEAVEMAESLIPDAIVMDIRMPRMDGIEATRIIKQKHSKIKILGLSLNEPSYYAEKMKNAGADEFLVKDTPASKICEVLLRFGNASVTDILNKVTP